MFKTSFCTKRIQHYFPITNILFIIFFSIFSLCSYAQNNLASSFIEYNKIYLKNPDDAIILCDQFISSQENDLKAFGYAGKAYVYVLRTNFDLADAFFEKAISQLEHIDQNKTEIEGYVYYFQSLRYLESHELETAIHILNKTINSCEGNCSLLLEIKLQSALGRLYSLSDKLFKAIEISNICLNKIKKAPIFLTEDSLQKEYLKELIKLAHRNMNVHIYNINDEYYDSYLDSTQHYAKMAKEYAVKNKISYYDVNITTLYGDINFYRHNYKVAKHHYEEVLKVYKARKRNKRVAQGSFIVAECDYFLKNWKQAETIFLQQIEANTWPEYQLLDFEALCHFYLFKIYEETEQPKKALKYATSYAEKIKAHIETKSASDISINTLVAHEKRKEEVKIFRENYQAQEKLKKVYLYLFFTSIVCISVFLIYFFKVKKKDKRNIRLLQTRIDQLQEDISKQNKPKTINVLTDENALKLIEKLKNLEKEELFLQPNYTLVLVAKRLNTNSSYLSKTVNNYLNLSFAEYSNRLRIRSIVKRLNEQKNLRNYTIEAIAKEAGYKSIGSFNTNFKKLLKVKPSLYIKELRQSEIQ
ncbi:helix-turn-helix domain-containing protein [Kordia sp.]|uniref:helix-turn-helix domain-containing protein n=1 Tax=Kordia sp. TaxID=1965332 RepID=UPI003B5C8933